MKNKKVKSNVLLLIMVCGSALLHAQTNMYVKEHSGIQTTYSIIGIKNLTFSLGNVRVNQNNGIQTSYPINTVRYINFINLSTSIPAISVEDNTISLYPNPVTDQLQISFESAKPEKVQVEIIDMQGKVLQQQTILIQNGTNHTVIPVSYLSQGLYFCRFKNDDKIRNIKFVKN